MADGSGRLYVVATPIGNLADIAPRAAETLRRVPIIACEDTRRSRPLLSHIGSAPAELLTLFDASEQQASARLLAKLRDGADAALISDAGTPLISDPGLPLLRAAWREGIAVTPIPGPSALSTAVAASPLPVDRFRFEGFLPARPKARRETLGRLLASDIAVVFFEAPHRMKAMLADLAALGAAERELLLCRELTKRFETLSFGTAAQFLAGDAVLDRGEFTCVLAPSPAPDAPADAADADRLLAALLGELAPAQAARLAAKATGAPRSALYRRALSIAGRSG